MARDTGRSSGTSGTSGDAGTSPRVTEAASVGTAGRVNTDVSTAEQTNAPLQAPRVRIPRQELPEDHPQVQGARSDKVER